MEIKCKEGFSQCDHDVWKSSERANGPIFSQSTQMHQLLEFCYLIAGSIHADIDQDFSVICRFFKTTYTALQLSLLCVYIPFFLSRIVFCNAKCLEDAKDQNVAFF